MSAMKGERVHKKWDKSGRIPRDIGKYALRHWSHNKNFNRVGARRKAFAPLTPPHVRFSVYGGSTRSSYTAKWTFAKRFDIETKPLCSNRLFVIAAWIVAVPHTY